MPHAIVTACFLAAWLVLQTGCTLESAGPVETDESAREEEFGGKVASAGQDSPTNPPTAATDHTAPSESASQVASGVERDAAKPTTPEAKELELVESRQRAGKEPAIGTTDSAAKSPSAKPRVPSRRPVAVTFDDLELKMQLDTKFDAKLLTDRAKELDGERVSIKGFIYAAGIFQQTGIRRFPLVKNTQCKFGPGGLAYCVILVTLKEGVTTNFTLQPVTVEGILKVEPFDGPDGNTWSVYRMVGERVY